MGPFNNREIATAFWLLVLFVFGMSKPRIREFLLNIVKAFCQKKILIGTGLMLFYVTGIVLALSAIGIWNVSLLKDTVIWLCFSALVTSVDFVTSDSTENIFRKIVVDNLKIVIFLEFLVNTYTFSLIAEIVIIPIIAFVAMLDVFVHSDNQYSAVARLTGAVLVFFGLVILAFAVSRAVSNLNNLQIIDSLRSVLLSPVLCILLSPFIYLMLLIAKYELIFLRLDFGSVKDVKLKKYAQRHIFMYAFLSLKKLQELLCNNAVDLMNINTKTDIDNLIESAQNNRFAVR